MKNKTTDSALKRNSTTIADVDLYIDGFEIPKKEKKNINKICTKLKINVCGLYVLISTS